MLPRGKLLVALVTGKSEQSLPALEQVYKTPQSDFSVAVNNVQEGKLSASEDYKGNLPTGETNEVELPRPIANITNERVLSARNFPESDIQNRNTPDNDVQEVEADAEIEKLRIPIPEMAHEPENLPISAGLDLDSPAVDKTNLACAHSSKYNSPLASITSLPVVVERVDFEKLHFTSTDQDTPVTAKRPFRATKEKSREKMKKMLDNINESTIYESLFSSDSDSEEYQPLSSSSDEDNDNASKRQKLSVKRNVTQEAKTNKKPKLNQEKNKPHETDLILAQEGTQGAGLEE
ncbi:uncharacterized protein LOC124374652, partial [Homalodisca vitripennis]|uniref:uncharacterized protein LOC124374652 n=1 Tax=Homalodisca vitripennis TaxID=197043 RepID=UPI001EEB91BD